MKALSEQSRTVKLLLYWTAPGLLILGLSLFVVASTLVGMFPETFGPYFSSFITYQEGGIYADCSLSANRRNRICSGITHAAVTDQKTKDWGTMQKSKKAMPFNLHGN